MENKKLEYGICIPAADEKKLVKNINAFLEKQCGYRKMYKRDHPSFLEARRPFVYTHFYNQFLKEVPGWYFEIYPNTDTEGKIKFKDHPQVGWVMFANKMHLGDGTPEQHQEVNDFFDRMLAATSAETLVLHTYKGNEDRL